MGFPHRRTKSNKNSSCSLWSTLCSPTHSNLYWSSYSYLLYSRKLESESSMYLQMAKAEHMLAFVPQNPSRCSKAYFLIRTSHGSSFRRQKWIRDLTHTIHWAYQRDSCTSAYGQSYPSFLFRQSHRILGIFVRDTCIRSQLTQPEPTPLESQDGKV